MTAFTEDLQILLVNSHVLLQEKGSKPQLKEVVLSWAALYNTKRLFGSQLISVSEQKIKTIETNTPHLGKNCLI